jgi:hypothetical protein
MGTLSLFLRRNEWVLLLCDDEMDGYDRAQRRKYILTPRCNFQVDPLASLKLFYGTQSTCGGKHKNRL